MLCSNALIIGVKKSHHLTICFVRVVLAIVDPITPTINVNAGSIIAGELLAVLACGQGDVEAGAVIETTGGVCDRPDFPSCGCV